MITEPFAATTTPTLPPRMPRWLRETCAYLGPADHHDGTRSQRWLWRDGDVGVRIDQLSAAWQVIAFCPRGSVTYRCLSEPTEPEIRATVNLAKLTADAVWAA